MKLGRNEKCHCGSGIKYKKCCLSSDLLNSNIKIEKALEKEKIYLPKTVSINNMVHFVNSSTKDLKYRRPISAKTYINTD